MIEGIVVNGQVCVPNPIAAPDGTRVVIDFLPSQPTADAAGWQEAIDDVAAGRIVSSADVKQKMDELITDIRESVEDMKAGRVIPGEEVKKHLRMRVQNHLDRLG